MPNSRTEQEEALRRADAELVATPKAPAPLFERARALDALGRNDEARCAYLDVLVVEPRHLQALLAVSTLCAKTGYVSAARTALRQAVAVDPNSSIAHGNLATLLLDAEEIAPARNHYQAAVRLDPGNLGAQKGLAILLFRQGELEAARRHGRLGFRGEAEAWPYRGPERPISVLLTLSALGGNLPILPLLDDRVFLKWTLLPEFFDPGSPLPPHDLAFNAIGDADRCGSALAAAAEVLSLSRAPLLNAPTRVLATGRAENARRLALLAGVVTARTTEWDRTALLVDGALDAAGLGWPLLVRSPGFHTGQNFAKVDGPHELRSAVESLPGTKLLAMQFIDTRSSDGKFRKYRVMAIDGRLYPLHLAVSSSWKVHYVTADMADHPEYRAEDEAFLTDMPGVLGPTVMATLQRLRAELGLDYGGLDFGLDGEGKVVVFEANATMVILPPGADERWSYRVAPVEQARQAVVQMLRARAAFSP